MNVFEERVVAERAELERRLTKLDSFIFTENAVFLALDKEDRDLLFNQFTAMADYSRILAMRIARFALEKD